MSSLRVSLLRLEQRLFVCCMFNSIAGTPPFFPGVRWRIAQDGNYAILIEGLKPLRIVLFVLTMRLAQLALPGSLYYT